MKRLATTLALFIISIPSVSMAQRYAEGDIVENFTLINRATGEPVSLYDFEGKVIFLEWFAYWCPFCQAAAAEIGPNLIEYYESRGGNSDGVEFMHVALNLQRNAENSTQSFIDFYRLPFVLNDFDREVANRFQNGGQPIFAIINGVANSPSHQLWELVYTRLGYGDLSQPITEFRQAVNSVRAAVEVPGFQKFVEDLNLPVNQRAEGDDPDYDGLVNAFEYHFGTDASDTASSILPVSRILSINGFEYQGLEYLRNPNATDLAVVAQFSPSPSFSSLNESLVHSVELVDGGLEKIVVRSLVPLGNGSEFSRLTLVSNTK
jgi:thiol-disulfide isomerase/thioredoxin